MKQANLIVEGFILSSSKPNEMKFNSVVASDLMNLESISALHVMDIQTSFSFALFPQEEPIEKYGLHL